MGEQNVAWNLHIFQKFSLQQFSFPVQIMLTCYFVSKFFILMQGFPTWGTCTPRGTYAYPKGYI